MMFTPLIDQIVIVMTSPRPSNQSWLIIGSPDHGRRVFIVIEPDIAWFPHLLNLLRRTALLDRIFAPVPFVLMAISQMVDNYCKETDEKGPSDTGLLKVKCLYKLLPCSHPKASNY